MRRALFVSILGVLGACGDDGGSSGQVDAATDGATTDSSTIDAAIDAPPGAFTLTSPTITEGGAIPATHACVPRGGMNLSPALAWANPPAGTMSFAIVFTDKTNGLIHSAIYDIPGTLTMLPADVDKVYAPPDVPGAHQPNAYTSMRGYAGPCPNTPHMYEHKIYALATATVPGTMMSTNRDQLLTALATNLGTTTLTATFTPP